MNATPSLVFVWPTWRSRFRNSGNWLSDCLSIRTALCVMRFSICGVNDTVTPIPSDSIINGTSHAIELKCRSASQQPLPQ